MILQHDGPLTNRHSTAGWAGDGGARDTGQSTPHGGRSTNMRSKGSIVLIIVSATLLAGLWPGRPAPENQVGWSAAGPGLVFEAASQCISEAPLWIDSGAITTELWLASGDPGISGNREIVSILDGASVHRLLIGQFPNGLILRGRLDNPAGDPTRDLYADGFNHEGLRHLAVTIQPRGVHLFANGRSSGLELASTAANEGVPFGGRILLGTSNSRWADWRGTVFALAVHRRALTPREVAEHAALDFAGVQEPYRRDRLDEPGRHDSIANLRKGSGLVALYLFEEGSGSRTASLVPGAPDLWFPERLIRPMKTALFSRSQSQPWLPIDITLNVLGFIPLGFAMARGRRSRGPWIALVFGVALSLMIESAQLWIPGRNPSLIDLFCNGAGTLLGGALGQRSDRLPRRPEQPPLSL
jgi:VanZ family protein